MKTFSTEYTAKNLTKHDGLVNLGKFAEKIGLPGIPEKRLTIESAINNVDTVHDMLGFHAFQWDDLKKNTRSFNEDVISGGVNGLCPDAADDTKDEMGSEESFLKRKSS